MYAYIKGTIEGVSSDGQVVVDNNGIGYNISVTSDQLSKLPPRGSEVKIYTYTHVKEDCFELYGFATLEDKNIFTKLISVSGVGCKSALAILSGIDAQSLALAIGGGDVKTLSTVKGVGKRTAERIIIELKDKMDLGEIQTAIGAVSDQAASGVTDDAVLALVSLGINRVDAIRAVNSARKLTNDMEQIITLALRSLN